MMRERVKSLIALIMTIMLLNQLPGFDVLVMKAAEISVNYSNDDITVTDDASADTYIFTSGGSTLNVSSGVTVGTVTSDMAGEYTINNSGIINFVSVIDYDTFYLNGGSYGSISLGNSSVVSVTGITVTGDISGTSGTVSFEGTNIVAGTLSANAIDGTGMVTVGSALSAQSIGSTVTVNVGKDTVINASTNDLTLYYDGTPYTITAGSTNTSIAQENGVYVTFKTTDENINWVASTETDNLNTYLMAGETTGTYKCTAVDGYYFPEGYSLSHDGDGSGTLTAVREDESTLTVSYSVSNTDATLETLTITFPALSKKLVDGSGELTIADIAYGESLNPVITSATHTHNGEVIEYKTSGADDSAYDVSVPTAVGNYDARITLAANDTYKELVLETSFNIVKAEGEGEFSVADIIYGETVVPQYLSATQDTAGATVEYKVTGAEDATYSTTAPTAVGDYTARVTIPASTSYEAVVLTDDFSITQAAGEVTISVESISYGQELIPNIVSATGDVKNAVVKYKQSGADDETYSEIVPTLVGNYIAKVILVATQTHTEATATAEFSILKAEGTATFSVEDITYGETVSPQISSTVYDVDNATVEYKSAGADDATYTPDIPTEVGSYSARVLFAANESYNQLILTDEFVIEVAPEEETPEEPATEAPETDNTEDEEVVNPQPGTGSLVVQDTYYGTSVNSQISSATNTVAGVSVEYKVLGAADATYTTKAPTAIGEYVARVTLPANDDYKEVVLTDEFAIDYLPVPANAYTLVGNTGDNGYYTSKVNVVARDGYVLSNSLNGEYVEQLTISSSQAATIVYFMDEATGAKTNGVSISAIDIDVDAPEVDAEGDNTYYGDSLAVAISDDNLASVTLNGKNVELDSNRTILDLKSNGGIEEYTIVVIDTAGHARNITIKVAAEWTKTGEIPSGSEVKLQAGTIYTLGSGTWTVSGDATSYNGNTTFYVGGDGSYTFNQQ